jgi:endonuclease/exonuclease/phosphatase family metal-dependent hydrolase
MCLVLPFTGRAEEPDPCEAKEPVHLNLQETAQPASETLTIASLNVAGQARIAEALERWTLERRIDVLLLQEVGSTSNDGEVFVTSLGERLAAHFAYASSDSPTSSRRQGLAIVSRYMLADIAVNPLNFFDLRFRSRCRIALAVTLKTGAGDVRIVNVHLDTRINSKDRLTQMAPVLAAAQAFDGPRLIGGDFNTMNIRWFRSIWPLPFLQRQSKSVRVWLGDAGFRTPFTESPATFKVLGFPMRLDWLYLNDLQPLEWGVDRVQFTDHRAVWVRVARARRGE